MLWVWPSSNPEAWIESYASPPPTDPELQDESWISAGSEWDFVEQPVSWQTLVRMAMEASRDLCVPEASGLSSRLFGAWWWGMHQGYVHVSVADCLAARL